MLFDLIFNNQNQARLTTTLPNPQESGQGAKVIAFGLNKNVRDRKLFGSNVADKKINKNHTPFPF